MDADAITFEPCRRFVDEWLTASEPEIARAMIGALDQHDERLEGKLAADITSVLVCHAPCSVMPTTTFSLCRVSRGRNCLLCEASRGREGRGQNVRHHLLRRQRIRQNVTQGTYTGARAAFPIERVRTSNEHDLRLVNEADSSRACNSHTLSS